MTTYIFQGYNAVLDTDDDLIFAQSAQLLVTVEDASAEVSFDNVIESDDYTLPLVDVGYEEVLSVTLIGANGTQLTFPALNSFDTIFGAVNYGGGQEAAVLGFLTEFTEWAFFLNGDEPDPIENNADVIDFFDTVTGTAIYTSGPFASDNDFQLSILDGATVTEDDVWVGTDADETVDLGDGRDVMSGEDGEDVLSGGNDKDELFGGKDKDKLFGDKGNDALHGDKGNDKLNGGKGRDELFGGSGKDSLEGGKSDDMLTGGNGPDTFLFRFTRDEGDDVITDFEDGVDMIKFKGGSFADLTIAAQSSDVLVTWANGSILLTDIAVSDVTDADFIF